MSTLALVGLMSGIVFCLTALLKVEPKQDMLVGIEFHPLNVEEMLTLCLLM